MWVKKYMKLCIMLFKMQKCKFELRDQIDFIYLNESQLLHLHTGT